MERKFVQDMGQLEKDWVIIDSVPLCLLNIPASGNQLLPLQHAQLFLPCNSHLLVVGGGFFPYFSIHSCNYGICVLVGKEHSWYVVYILYIFVWQNTTSSSHSFTGHEGADEAHSKAFQDRSYSWAPNLYFLPLDRWLHLNIKLNQYKTNLVIYHSLTTLLL